MTCTFCGSLLDGTEAECPYCGHKLIEVDDAPVAPEKSKAAAEFISKFAARKSSPDREEYDEEPKPRKKVSAPSVSGTPTMILAIALAALLLVSLISLFAALSANAKLKDLEQNLLSQVYVLQNNEKSMANDITEIKDAMGLVQVSIETQNLSRTIKITKQPTEVATYLGRGGEDDDIQNVIIFSVQAEGSNLEFTWQKYDQASGSWVNILFDPDNNDTYGLHLYSTENESQLCAHGVTELGFGLYRCHITDATGYVDTDPVYLNERDK